MNPLVSVIVPVYNVKDYLCECLDSIVGQTYQNIEVIVVDDGSFDGSDGICEYYSDIYGNLVVVHKKNGGQSSARNYGINIANGKYIYFIDSDDYMLCDAIEKLVNEAEKNSADLVFFDAHSFIDGNNKEIRQTYHRIKQYSPAEGLEMFDRLSANKEYFISPCLIFTTKELVNCNEMRFVEGIIYEDMIYTFIVFCKAKLALGITENLYERRYRESSTVTSKKTKYNFDSTIEVFKRVLSFADKENIVNIGAVKNYICRCAYAVINCYRDLSSIDKKRILEEYKDFKKILKYRKNFQNKALSARCIGYFPWVCMRTFQKLSGGTY